MLRCVRSLSSWASAHSPLALDQLDVGDVVAVLIVMIGLASFASTGLWAP
jgi:hypothetical protein